MTTELTESDIKRAKGIIKCLLEKGTWRGLTSAELYNFSPECDISYEDFVDFLWVLRESDGIYTIDMDVIDNTRYWSA